MKKTMKPKMKLAVLALLAAVAMTGCECLDESCHTHSELHNATGEPLYFFFTNDSVHYREHLGYLQSIEDMDFTWYDDVDHNGPDNFRNHNSRLNYFLLLYGDTTVAAVWNLRATESDGRNPWMNENRWAVDSVLMSPCGNDKTCYIYTFTIDTADLQYRR